MDDYIQMLEYRKEFVEEKYGWKQMPDSLWQYFINSIEECGGVAPEHASPSCVVDNAIVNGDWGDFDNYMDEGETDEEFIKRVKDETCFIDADERVVCYSI